MWDNLLADFFLGFILQILISTQNNKENMPVSS